jgi:LPS export ABC transporter protein LptC
MISKFKSEINLLVVLILAFLASSCESKVDLIRKSDLLNYPSLTGKNITEIVRDSGNIQYILKTPLMEQYNTDDSPYSEFRKGGRIVYYEGDTVPRGSVTAKYAKYTKKDETWQLRDSVVVVNENNEKLETELLFYDMKKDLIYTDRFVKITTEKSILQGIGFESDSHLNHRKIRNPSAEIYIDEEDSQ